MRNVVYVKIYIKKNQYAVRFRSSRLKGEMTCRNLVELDNRMCKITRVFPDITFNVKFSEGAMGKYSRELDSPKLLFKTGFKFLGYLGKTNSRVFFNHESYELVIIDENGWLKKYKLN